MGKNNKYFLGVIKLSVNYKERVGVLKYFAP